MIIAGGENIASSEVERVLYQMPQVAEAAAIGLPDERWGECVVAVVVLKAGESLDLPQLLSFCSGRLGGFKTPKKLFLRTSCPAMLRARCSSAPSGTCLAHRPHNPHFTRSSQ